MIEWYRPWVTRLRVTSINTSDDRMVETMGYKITSGSINTSDDRMVETMGYKITSGSVY